MRVTDNQTVIPIKPCPFCGSDAELVYVPRQVTWGDNEGLTKEGVSFSRMPAGHVCACSKCGTTGPYVADDYKEVTALAILLSLKPKEYVLRSHPGASKIQDVTKTKAISLWNNRIF